ncbi:hypothetical protein DFH08DRAFT_970080 [Mycena albidolilacea]|uniref:C2H2-type domain-containing protein n=1 Tax=Mycena albidolilacea TaxID=1033008 RepID=A0AAD7EHF9_9AGAR|nr:hypothetical protein DFH08DRAFT_970080 [Mycena albidolilacea]
MLLSIPVQDLLSSRFDIKLGDAASRLSCKFKPNVHHVRPAPQGWAGITINIESVQGENGCRLTLYASSDEAPSTSAAESPGLPPVRQDFSLGTMLPSMNMDQEAMSFLLSDTSPPQDYYSPFCSSASSSVMSPPSHGDLHHDLSFDFASGCLSPDMGDHSDFDSQHFSHLLDMASPRCHSGESDCIELPSPYPSVSAPSSTSSPSPPPTTFIACAMTPTPPPPKTDTPPADTAPTKIRRRGQYPCLHPSCSRVLTSPYTRQVHMGTHSPKPRKAFLCTMGCGEAFTRQHDRHRHEVALHGKRCTHVCARCERFFSTAKMLDRHVCRGHRQGAIQWPLGVAAAATPSTQ